MATAALVAVSAVTGCTGKAVSSDSIFTPKETINWVVTSGPGGGSDIYTRVISDIMTEESLVNGQPIVVTNKTDGGDEIGRNEVAVTKGNKTDCTLLAFNSGDLISMVQNAKNRSSDFRILIIMIADKQLTFRGEQTKYADFKGAIEAVRNDTKIVVGGSRGDDIAIYDAMLEETGISKDAMSHITYDSTDNAITAALGGHMEFVISKPAAVSGYMMVGSLIPMLALSTERYTGNLADVPTLSETGNYENVEVPVWRGVVAPAAMNDAAVTYRGDQLGEIAETNTWKNDYLEKNELIDNYMDTAVATEYATIYEKDYMTANGTQ